MVPAHDERLAIPARCARGSAARPGFLLKITSLQS